MLGFVAVLAALGYFVIWPRLDEFTSGGLSARFQDTNTTGRDDLSMEDLKLFARHPLLGVGPGRSAFEHDLGLAAHTEFSRLLAEHGLFGCAWMLVMALAAYRNVKRGRSPYERGFSVAMMTWGFLFMANSAMRLVAPCLTFGMGFVQLLSADQGVAASVVQAEGFPQPRRLLVWARP
jgi:O-antigen ligase